MSSMNSRTSGPDKKVVLTAADLDGYLTSQDKDNLHQMDELYKEAFSLFEVLNSNVNLKRVDEARASLIKLYEVMGQTMQQIIKQEPSVHVYSFDTPKEIHGEASRLIAKLRNPTTQRHEFVYYIQRAYELLFNLAYTGPSRNNKNYLLIDTPVDIPVQNYAVHKIPDIDSIVENVVMCVMLRGALLPSLIVGKEIEEYSSGAYVAPYALFKIKRDDSKQEHNMEYILDLKKSFFSLADLEGKDLVFADPMNATGGSLVTIIKYINDQGVKPKSVTFLNVISALKGALRTVRALDDVMLYTLWMDPVLNNMAYILPGLGDAGDRLNGPDVEDKPRNIIQLIGDYGSDIVSLYRSQVQKIEETVLDV